MRGAHFRAVDTAPAPQALVATLDAVAAREGVRRLKRHGLDILAVTAGQRLLDVGCGTGDDVRALAGLLGPSGLVVGVEPSEVLLAEARRRAADSPLPLRFAAGDASDLPFPADRTLGHHRLRGRGDNTSQLLLIVGGAQRSHANVR